MRGLRRTLVAGALGAAVLGLLPRQGVLSASQELIGFLSLLMAGLLPAMTLTATILRGEGFSSKRVKEYGGALREQLKFWAALFGFAAVATLGIVVAKVFSAADRGWSANIGGLIVSNQSIVEMSLWAAGAGLGVVIRRLYASYEGLASLLDLNVSMAQAAAIAQDRTALDALNTDLQGVINPPEYRSGSSALS